MITIPTTATDYFHTYYYSNRSEILDSRYTLTTKEAQEHLMAMRNFIRMLGDNDDMAVISGWLSVFTVDEVAKEFVEYVMSSRHDALNCDI